jgi:hypothetical protein
MDDRYFHGILGCEAVVCGRRLSNLTPWHVALMEMNELPFTTGEGAIEPKHILQIVRVTQSSFPNEPDMSPCKIRDLFWLWKMRKKKVFIRELSKLNSWLDVQTSMPRLWQSSGSSKGKSLSAPSMLLIVMALASKTAITDKDAWNTRLSLCRWYDTTLAELEGADIKLAYDGEDSITSILKGKSESEIIAIAKEQLGSEDFKKWHSARRKNRK